MSQQLFYEKVGEFSVSTIRTLAGGSPENRSSIAPFSESDYDTPWPFETLVQKGSVRGHYHEVYCTLEEAASGHKRIVAMIADCNKYGYHHWQGKGVDGTAFGNPSLTGDQWRALQHMKTCKKKRVKGADSMTLLSAYLCCPTGVGE